MRLPHQMLFFLLLLLMMIGLFCTLLLTGTAPSDEKTMIAWLKDNQAILPDVLAYLQEEQTTMTRETFRQFDQLYRSGTLIVRFVGGTTESGERYLHYAPDNPDLQSLSPLTAEEMADFTVTEQDADCVRLTDGSATIKVERVEDGWYVVEYRK